MTQQKRILLADDEVVFLKATSSILHENGYKCDCAVDADSVLEMLATNDYDLLISDINMPGNSDMELFSKISKIADGMPVILVTAYPSIDNTIQALKFHIYDYLLKPVDFDDLLARVRHVLKSTGTRRDVTLEVRESIRKWRQELVNIEEVLSKTSKEAPPLSVDSYLDLSFKNMFDTLMNLKNVTKTIAVENDEQTVCDLVKCSRLTVLKDALAETVAILKKTRNTFKSKDLGALREKLERLLEATS